MLDCKRGTAVQVLINWGRGNLGGGCEVVISLHVAGPGNRERERGKGESQDYRGAAGIWTTGPVISRRKLDCTGQVLAKSGNYGAEVEDG